MNNKILFFSVILLISCNNFKCNPKTIIINLCEPYKTDSINHLFKDNQLPFKCSKNEELENLYINQYVISMNKDSGYCLYSITDSKDFFLFYMPENIVGYDICFIYDKAHLTLYQTEEHNHDVREYTILYETYNLFNHSIDILFKNGQKERIHFKKCTDNRILL